MSDAVRLAWENVRLAAALDDAMDRIEQLEAALVFKDGLIADLSATVTVLEEAS